MFNVSVVRKTPAHPYYGMGSELGFVVNGVEGPILNLVAGTTYTFNVHTPGHPFYFSTSAKGGAGAPGLLFGVPPTENGAVRLTVPYDIDRFYYQCANHDYMGYMVAVSKPTATPRRAPQPRCVLC